MADLDLQGLLSPVSAASPCGVDLSSDNDYVSLSQRADLGLGGADDEAAERTRWAEVQRLATVLLLKTKDVWPVTWLTTALLKQQGFPGLRDGLELLRGLLDQHWDGIYPRKDPEDEFPVQRITAISEISSPAFVGAVRGAQVCEPRQSKPLTLRDLLIATGDLQVPPSVAAQKPDLPKVRSIIESLSGRELTGYQNNIKAVRLAIEHIDAVTRTQSEKIGPRNVADLGDLRRVLDRTLRLAEGFGAPLEPVSTRQTMAVSQTPSSATQPMTPAAPAADSGPQAVVATAAAPRAASVTTITSRDDVLRIFDMVCKFYQNNEPSSPVPLLIQRAKKLVTMSYLDIVKDMTPEALKDVEKIAGIQPEPQT